MKSKRWGGGLNIMGLCFSASEEDQGSLQKHQRVKNDPCHKKNQHHGQSHPVQESQGGNGIEKNKGSSTSSFRHAAKDVKELRQNPGYSNVDIFTFEEMKLATKHFRPDLVVGEGGFGVVYKGVIDESVRPGYKAVEVAIKQLNPNGFQGDKEWLVFVCKG